MKRVSCKNDEKSLKLILKRLESILKSTRKSKSKVYSLRNRKFRVFEINKKKD